MSDIIPLSIYFLFGPRDYSFHVIQPINMGYARKYIWTSNESINNQNIHTQNINQSMTENFVGDT